MDFQPQGYTQDGIAIFGTDDRMMARFFHHPSLSKFKSDEAGRPVYDDILMIEVIQPGEKDPVRVLANQWHKNRFPKQWEAFQNGIKHESAGTRLEHLFPSEPGQIKSLEAVNIFTVEQLAQLSDGVIGQIPMGRDLVHRAQAYLSTAAGGSQFHQMQRQIEQLQAKLMEMTEKVALNPEPPRRGPGRPPNSKPNEGAVA